MPKKSGKGKFHLPERIEADYRRGLERSLLRWIGAAGKGFGGIVENLHRLSETNLLSEFARTMANRMVTHVRASNARSWQEAAKTAGKGAEIYTALRTELSGAVGNRVRELLEENSRLIKSIPSELAAKAAKDIAEMQQKGMRPADIAKQLQQQIPKLARSRIALIARTESSKAATVLSQARSEQLDLPAYEWSTSHDQRVRQSHKFMEGVVVFWSEPPSPEALIGEHSTLGKYHAGNCPNCRCDPLPLVSLDEVRWPKKVYHNGSISYWTRTKFVDFLKRRGLKAA